MQTLRSLAFNAAFYLNTFLWCLVALPALLLPQRQFLSVVRAWVHCTLWLARLIVGVRVRFRGMELIPPGPLLVAAKHQSSLETFALLLAFEAPVFILKRQLMQIPVFGWYLKRLGFIPVDREAGANALRAMMTQAKAAVSGGHQLIIFPEGTRRPPGAEPDYKPGIIQMYRMLGVRCLPVALNTGLFWPRRSLAMTPGTAVIEMLPLLPDDLPRRDMLDALVAVIEPASERLLAEGVAISRTC